MRIEDARANIGEMVSYSPFKGCDDTDKEYGTITDTTDSLVYVKYEQDKYAKAVRPEAIELEQ